MSTPATGRDYDDEAQVLAHALCAQIDLASSRPQDHAWVVRLPNLDRDASLLLRFSPPEARGRIVVECVLALDGVSVRASDYLGVEAMRACRFRRRMSLSLSRKASDMAEEIKGRLMPGYIDVLEKIRAQRGEQGAAQAHYAHGPRGYATAPAGHRFIIPTLLASIGLHSTEWTGHRWVVLPRLVTGGPQIDVKVESEQDGTVHLSISELPLERAKAVLQLICDLR
jgi:hypothetical protein